MMQLREGIAASFFGVHHAIKDQAYTHYWLKGGRGSTKSSFTSIEIILEIMKRPDANAVVLRKYATDLRESVYAQMLWAIDKLGVTAYFQARISPMKIVYIPTGQSIIFHGLDDPQKIKSIKFRNGYPRLIWFEEVTQFRGMEEIRNVLQSLMRGGRRFSVFYSYNPAASVNNWVNQEVQIEREDRLVHHSDYTTVPSEWLGEQFLIEAEHLKKAQLERYTHEYLGEVTGTGGEVFRNVTLRTITDAEIAQFDRIRRGLDWGYAIDPFAYNTMHYDKTRRRLYIFFEIHKVNLSNRAAMERIKAENPSNNLITCDSAEPKSIAEMRGYGLYIHGSKKGPDSVEYGIKFLQDLEEIIIDPKRCPHTAREFTSYEVDRDVHGELKAKFPDRDNHHIDAARYALNDQIKGPGIRFPGEER